MSDSYVEFMFSGYYTSQKGGNMDNKPHLTSTSDVSTNTQTDTPTVTQNTQTDTPDVSQDVQTDTSVVTSNSQTSTPDVSR